MCENCPILFENALFGQDYPFQVSTPKDVRDIHGFDRRAFLNDMTDRNMSQIFLIFVMIFHSSKYYSTFEFSWFPENVDNCILGVKLL